VAQHALARRGLKQWVLMETVDDSGWRGILRQLEYHRVFMQWRGRLQGVLAMGERTFDWVAARGMPASRVFPFAYFLRVGDRPPGPPRVTDQRFRFIFVGRLTEGKRIDLLISALAALNRTDVELEIVGAGHLEKRLRIAAEAALPGHAIWTGQLPITFVSSRIAMADCLVLPSRFDGWGAVVSEALMVGTPAICSDRCGAAGVVRASGTGGVFQSGNHSGLIERLTEAMTRGRISHAKRSALADWASCLGAEAGARYLINILDYADGRVKQPPPPWEDVRSAQF
jgi:glycosyltransferase involved in cell wall biosynthesis